MLGWIDGPGDRDGDGLLEYRRARARRGLRNQGWKDSEEGILDEHGRRWSRPIALIEPQAYALRAKRRLARLFALDGDARRAVELLRRQRPRWASGSSASGCRSAATTRWASAPTAARARALASNQGHLLWARAVPPERARAMRDALMSDAMFSGWGIRTLAAGEAGYNPVGYHLGTVWPHDTAMIALGLREYGFDEDFARIFEALLDAGSNAEGYRLPELFAGFSRTEFETPVPYPVACQPQAWAAGAIPYLVQSGLGLMPDGLGGACACGALAAALASTASRCAGCASPTRASTCCSSGGGRWAGRADRRADRGRRRGRARDLGNARAERRTPLSPDPRVVAHRSRCVNVSASGSPAADQGANALRRKSAPVTTSAPSARVVAGPLRRFTLTRRTCVARLVPAFAPARWSRCAHRRARASAAPDAGGRRPGCGSRGRTRRRPAAGPRRRAGRGQREGREGEGEGEGQEADRGVSARRGGGFRARAAAEALRVYAARPGPRSSDCSGLILAAYRSIGRKVPRTTFGQLARLRTPGRIERGDWSSRHPRARRDVHRPRPRDSTLPAPGRRVQIAPAGWHMRHASRTVID